MKENKITVGCDRVMFYSFCALIYFLPISIALVETFSAFIFTAYFVKHSVYYYYLVGEARAENMLFRFGRSFLRAYKPVSSHLSWPIAVYIIISFVSIIFSPYFRGFEGFVGKLIQQTFLFFSFLECMKSSKHLRRFLMVYFISVTLIVINGLVQVGIGKGFIHGHVLGSSSRAFSSFGHPNDLGGYLVLVTPVLLWLSIRCRPVYEFPASRNGIFQQVRLFFYRYHNLMLFVLFLLSLTCLGMTFSRGAWMGLVAGFVFLGFQRKRLFAAILIIMTIFIGIFYPQMEEKRGVGFMTDYIPRAIDYNAALAELKEKIAEDRLKLAQDKIRLSRELGENALVPIPASAGEWDFGQDDFTIQFWYYPHATKDNNAFFSLINNVSNAFYFRWNGSSASELGLISQEKVVWGKGFTGIQEEAWNHIAIERRGAELYCFINGKSYLAENVGSKTLTYPFVAIGFWSIGSENFGFLDGYIFDFRFIKGKAVWTDDFDVRPLVKAMDMSVRENPSLVVTGKTIDDQGRSSYSVNAFERTRALVLYDPQQTGLANNVSFENQFLAMIYVKDNQRLLEDHKAIEKIKAKNNKAENKRFLGEIFSVKNIVEHLSKFGGSGRTGYWLESINMIKDYPLLGVGFDAYRQAAPQYKITWGGPPHNCFLQLTAETGLLGLLVFFWILIALFCAGIGQVFVITDRCWAAALLGFLAGLFGFLCHSFVDTNFYSEQLGNLMWIVMAIIVVIPRIVEKNDPK